MKLIYKPQTVTLNVFTKQMPEGSSFEFFIPSWTKTVVIDGNGKIYAVEADSTNRVDKSSNQWLVSGYSLLVADLEFDVANYKKYKFEIDSDNTVFEIREGI